MDPAYSLMLLQDPASGRLKYLGFFYTFVYLFFVCPPGLEKALPNHLGVCAWDGV